MSVLIKNIDKELYAKFKATAALRGLRINDALCEAMKIWIQTTAPKNEIDNERIKNNALYRRIVPDLLPKHENDWIIISNGELIGIYPDRMTAIKKIEELNLNDKVNLVSPITKTKRKVTLGFGSKVS